MASKNYLSRPMYETLSPRMQEWVRELDYWGYRRAGEATGPHRHIEERLNIASSHKGRVIPKDLRGRFTLPGTDYQFQVYASGAAPRRRGVKRRGPVGLKRVYAICPECGKEVEAGHVSQHAFKHAKKPEVQQLAEDVRGLLK
jgi:hypothetical protein